MSKKRTSVQIRKRLEHLRRELRAERISWGELAELQGLAKHIDPSDVELLEAAGVKESRRKSYNPDDEEMEGEDDFDLREEMREGGVIGDGRGGLYNVSLSGKHLDSFSDYDKALKYLVQTMEDEKYYPNIFYVNDHGNVDLLGVRPKTIKGKVISVKSEILRSWV